MNYNYFSRQPKQESLEIEIPTEPFVLVQFLKLANLSRFVSVVDLEEKSPESDASIVRISGSADNLLRALVSQYFSFNVQEAISILRGEIKPKVQRK